MLSLFEDITNYPSGFSYKEDLISTEEESFLLNEINKLQLDNFIFHGYEAKRKTASFGFDYHFRDRSLTDGKPIPEVFFSIMQKAADYASLQFESFKELLVTEYPEGSVINWHRDAPPFDVIVGISLAADCVFKLRPYNKENRSRKTTVTVRVKRRSIYILRDEARTEWEHSIAPVKNKRFSITLRTLR